MVDLPDEKIGCHRTGFAKKCRALVTSGACNRWMAVRGTHPNTGEPIERSDCVDNWTPTLLMENSKLQRETGAAIESFRNEMVAANAANAFNHMLSESTDGLLPNQHVARLARS